MKGNTLAEPPGNGRPMLRRELLASQFDKLTLMKESARKSVEKSVRRSVGESVRKSERKLMRQSAQTRK